MVDDKKIKDDTPNRKIFAITKNGISYGDLIAHDEKHACYRAAELHGGLTDEYQAVENKL